MGAKKSSIALRQAWLGCGILCGIACAADPGLGPRLATVDPPFPCDLLTVDDPTRSTGLAVALDAVPVPVLDPLTGFSLWPRDELLRWTAGVDGFSTFGPLFWRADAALDPTSLPEPGAPPEASVFLVNLQRDTPRFGERVAIRVGYDAVEDEDLGAVRALYIEPTEALAPGALHGVVATRQLRDAAGEPLRATDFFAVLAGRRELEVDSPLRTPMQRLRERAAPLFEHLQQQSIAADDVAHAFVFTTQSSPEVLAAARAVLRDPARPVAVRWGAAHPPASLPGLPAGVDRAPLGALSTVLTGELDVPDLRDGEGGVPWPLRADGVLRVPFILALPATGDGRPAPVVVLQHGHSGTKELALHVAPHLAAAGIATAAIDHMGHGALAHTGSFIEILDLQRFRGNLVQTAVNALRLVQLLAATDSVQAGGATYPLRTDDGIGYIGESLGGITGVPLSAVEPDVGVAVFNVAGGGIATSLAGSYLQLMSKHKLLLRLGFTAVFQMLLDPMDPVSFAALLRRGDQQLGRKPVLMQNVASDPLGTETVETLAAAIGAAYVCPCPPEIALPRLTQRPAPADPPGLFYFAEGRHGCLLAEGSSPAASEGMRRQAARFFGSHFAGDGAVIVDPFAP